VVLEVADNGHGFVPQIPSGGLGLASMRERASGAGGVLTVRSGPGGTRVRMTVPIKSDPLRADPLRGGPGKAGGER
jgi:signal transduction histidine kinase